MPNVHYVKLYSEILGQRVRVKATSQVLRIVDKLGGLDNYLLKYKPEKLDSQFGVWLRDKVQKQLELVCNSKFFLQFGKFFCRISNLLLTKQQ